jgi:hypothetical protein
VTRVLLARAAGSRTRQEQKTGGSREPVAYFY